MRIAVAADHAGFALKERLRRKLAENGHQIVDHGTTSEESVDYPDFAAAVARDVAGGKADRGLLVCASGVGMSIAANKVRGVRAALATNSEEVRLTRAHNDANVLAVGAKFTAEDEAEKLLDVFLSTEFEGGRHARRLEKIRQLEQEK
jgi:ribose 5-phosphate isomerase B